MLFYLLCCIALAVAKPTPVISPISDARSISSRVIGGTDASLGEFPWQVTLQQSGIHFCGGSLISSNHVITSAFCRKNLITVGLGALDNRNPQQTVSSASITVHPNYNSNTFDYDFAIITLSTAANLGGNIQTIQLANANREYSGMASITGWGEDIMIGEEHEHDHYHSPVIMQKADIPLMSASQCQNRWGSAITITNRIQCAGGNGVVGPCTGDSGGPLFVEENGTNVLVGIASWTEINCDPDYPSGYSKISAVRSWIDNIIF